MTLVHPMGEKGDMTDFQASANRTDQMRPNYKFPVSLFFFFFPFLCLSWINLGVGFATTGRACGGRLGSAKVRSAVVEDS